MHNSIKKLALLFILIFILPLSIFFIYQFAKLNQSEKEINKIYLQQLETIIYSINQYSEDVMSNWANEIKIDLSRAQESNNDILEYFITNNPSIRAIIIFDDNLNSILIKSNTSILEEENVIRAFREKIESNKSLIERLKNFLLDVGYEKIEAVGKISQDNLNLSVFAIKNRDQEIKFCGIVFEPFEFVRQNLVPKISQACGDEFILSVNNDIDNSIIYSCDKIDFTQLTLLKPLWLIPGFSLGIKMKSGNIEDLVSERYYENLIVLGVLLIILIIGIGLIYRNLRKELALTQLKSDFISNVSHELRTPLSLISMYSETLVLDRLKDENKKKEYYSVINNETNRLSKIVNSILNFSKMESGTRKYNFSKVNLVEINNELLKTYDYHIKSKGFTYTSDIIGKIENIYADQDAISESIINLIENAIKYSNNNKQFIIKIDQNKIGPFWEIKDFGVGISKEDQSKIFDKFFRVSSGLVHNTKGTGLGLTLVKQIMDSHNGQITVNSSVGQGSTFRLQFNKNFLKI
jgi:two-component system phosphate regulon sensor histidine kinase PhoR